MNQIAISFGINKYQNFPEDNLSGCVNDSMTMRKLFQEGLGFTWDSCGVLWDADCTKKGMLDGLDMALQNFGWLERVLWSHSGHGTLNPQPLEPDGQEGALVCHDLREQGADYDPNTMLLETDLEKMFVVLPATCLFEVFLDACYVEDFAESYNKIIGQGRSRCLSRRMVIKPVLHRVMGARDEDTTVIWAACGDNQTSAENWIDGKAQGAFTYYFTREFQPDMPRWALLDKVTHALKVNGYSQRPVLRASDRLRNLPVGAK